jgi:phospholipid transport system substrate-binding protein
MTRSLFLTGSRALAVAALTMAAFVGALSLAVAQPAVATSAATLTPQASEDFIKNLGEKAITLLTDQNDSGPARSEKFRQLLLENFDIPTIGRFTLGRYWRVATPPQREEFVQLLERMIVSTYRQRLDDYQGQTIEVRGSRAQQQYTLVESIVFDPQRNVDIPVEWRLVSTASGPKIIDVTVEGISMGLTQRSEFASVIERNGGRIDGLLNEMRRRYAGPTPAVSPDTPVNAPVKLSP